MESHVISSKLGSTEGRTGLEQKATFSGYVYTEKSDQIVRRKSRSTVYNLLFRFKVWIQPKDLWVAEGKPDRSLKN